MWAEFQKQQAVEREQLRRLLDEYRDLLQTKSPDPVQLYALAGLLHSFYTGIENIFKRAVTFADAATRAAVTGHGPRRVFSRSTRGHGGVG